MSKEVGTKTENSLPNKLNRRQLFKATGVLLPVSLILSSCDVGVEKKQTICPESGCPPLNADLNFRNQIEEILQPIRNLMTPAMSDFPVTLWKSNSNTTQGFAFSDFYLNSGIAIYLPDTEASSLKYGLAAANHEGVHMFNNLNNNFPEQYLRIEMLERIGRNKYTDDELRFFTESEYNTDPLWKNMGHPQDGYGEFLASALTILRFFPDEFINRLNTVPDLLVKSFLATSGLVCIDSLKKYAVTQIEYDDLPFQEKLIDYLYNTGQPEPTLQTTIYLE